MPLPAGFIINEPVGNLPKGFVLNEPTGKIPAGFVLNEPKNIPTKDLISWNAEEPKTDIITRPLTPSALDTIQPQEEQKAAEQLSAVQDLTKPFTSAVTQPLKSIGSTSNAVLGIFNPTWSWEDKKNAFKSVDPLITAESLDATSNVLNLGALIYGVASLPKLLPMLKTELSAYGKDASQLYRQLTIKERQMANMSDDELMNIFKGQSEEVQSQMAKFNPRVREMLQKSVPLETAKPIVPETPVNPVSISPTPTALVPEIKTPHTIIAKEVQADGSVIPIIRQNTPIAPEIIPTIAPQTAPVEPTAPIVSSGEPSAMPPKYKSFLDNLGYRINSEAKGQAILEDADIEGKTPNSIVTEFQANTYGKLPDEVKQRFDKLIKIHGTDLGDSIDNLEGTERGFVSLMEAANKAIKTTPIIPKTPIATPKQEINPEMPISEPQKVVNAPAVKEPWQMTKDEWMLKKGKEHDNIYKSNTKLGKLQKFNRNANIRFSAEQQHRNSVDFALYTNKPVPEEVLKDYPELRDIKPFSKAVNKPIHPPQTAGKVFNKIVETPTAKIFNKEQKNFEPDVTILGGNAKVARDALSKARENIEATKKYKFHFNKGDSVTDRETGKKYIVENGYMENGEPRYNIHVPGKKHYPLWIKEKDLVGNKIFNQPKAGGIFHKDMATSAVNQYIAKKGLKFINEDVAPKIVRLTQPTTIKDIHGQTHNLRKGEEFRQYELSDNKTLVQDGERFIVSDSKIDDLNRQGVVLGKQESFGKEFQGLDETVKEQGGKTKSRLSDSELASLTQQEANDYYKKDIEDNTKYSQYTLPGGENYREVLIKAPKINREMTTLPAEYTYIHDQHGVESGEEWAIIPKSQEHGRSLTGTYYPTKEKALEATLEYLNLLPKDKNNFRSSHWDEPNVLAHLRMNDRETGGGYTPPQKVAFIEEIQSDWAREGRDKGFTKQLGNLTAKQQDSGLWDIYNEQGQAIAYAPKTAKTEAEAIHIYTETQQEHSRTVPNHPALKNWQELTLKRALKEAIDSDAKYLSWISGEQTADRYSLAKQVKDIKAESVAEADNVHFVDITTNEGHNINLEVENGKVRSGDNTLIGKNLDDVIGKDMAEKILNLPKGESKTFADEDLKIGGDWAKNLYDRQIPSILEKMTKRYGGKVESINIGDIQIAGENREYIGDNFTIADLRQKEYPNVTMEKQSREVIDDISRGLSFKDAMTKQSQSLAELFGGDLVSKKKEGLQQALRITPEIRAWVKGEAIQPMAGGKMHFEGEAKPDKDFENFSTIESLKEAKDFIGKVIKQNVSEGLIGDVSYLKDISGFKGQFRDVYRNFEAVFGKGEEGQIVKSEYLGKFDKAKGEFIDEQKKGIDALNKNVVDKYGFKKGSKESAAIQDFGEKKVNHLDLVKEFGEKKAQQIVDADKFFRAEYDHFVDTVNSARKTIYGNLWEKKANLDKEIQIIGDSLARNKAEMLGKDRKDTLIFNKLERREARLQEAIKKRIDLMNSDEWWRGKMLPKRQDYYRHFQDMSDGIEGLINAFENPSGISPKLSGISPETKPKSKFAGFMQRRTGDDSKRDAIGGFLNYVPVASYSIHIDPHIMKFRALAADLAKKTEETKNLNNFIEFLQDYSNDLAGKTNPADRYIQKIIPGGRTTMRVIGWLNNRVKANTILGNASSSLAQIFNVPQAIGSAKMYSVSGATRTMAQVFEKNPQMEQSVFIKERYAGKMYNKFDVGILKNTKQFAAWMVGALDEVGTRFTWNAHYAKAIGEKIPNPIKYADDMTRKMVAGRGVGEVPLGQKSKMFQLVAPFQLEVSNAWWVMKDFMSAKDFAGIAAMMAVGYLMNRVAENVRGSDVVFDPVNATFDGYKAFKEEPNTMLGLTKFGGRLGGEVLSNMPFGQTMAAMYPQKGVFGVKAKDLFGKGDPTRYGGGILVTKGIQDPLFKIVFPFAGGQVKKSYQGIKAVIEGQVTNSKGKKLFNVGNDPISATQAALFGKYSSQDAQDYFDKRKPSGISNKVFNTRTFNPKVFNSRTFNTQRVFNRRAN